MAPSEKASPLSSPSPSPQDHAVRIPEKHPSGLDPSRLPFLTERGDTVSVRGILEASPSEQLKPFLQSSLDAACRRGHVEIVRLLVTAGAPVASTDRDGFTPLHRAAKKGSLDSVQYLLDHCEDRKSYVQACYQTPRIRVWPIPYRWEQNSALSCAAGEGHLDVVRYLVEAGADPLQELQNNGIAAHSACRGAKDYVQVVKYLMNVDRSQLEKRTSDEDDTCLHLAAQKDHIESAELLLSIGANHRARNAEGNTPWQVAHKAKSSNVMGALLRMEIYDRYQHEGIWRRLLEKMREASTYTYLFPGRKEYYWGGNKLILATLNDPECAAFLGLKREDLFQVIRQIDRTFIEHNEPDGTLCVREATCTVESLANNPDAKFLSLAMPYLYSENLEFLTKRRGASLARPSTLIYCLTNDPKDFGADVEVTLDEFCNPALDSEVLKQRNRDQVLTRYGQRKLGLSTGHNQSLSPELLSQLRLITVPQIWCWKIGSRLIFSCPKSANEDLKALRISPQTDNPDVFIGRLLSRFVDTLDRPKMLGLSEPIFSVFSKSIAIVAEDVNRYTRTAEFDDISIEKETQYLHVINDIREEIAMIQTVLFQQEEVWKEFVYNTWPDAEDRYFQGPGRSQTQSKIWRPPEAQSELWREIFKPQSQFPKFRRRFEKLDEDAERVERNILVKLDLKQKHASIKETHTATVMSAAIVGFTVITIIFAPLSFLTSLFALPVDQFRQDNGQYAGSYIGKWIATGEMVSLAVTLIAILIACDYFLNLRVTSRLWRKKSLEAKEKKQAGSWDGSMTGDTPNEKQAGNGEGRRHFLWHSKPRRQRKSRAADLEEALNSTEVP